MKRVLLILLLLSSCGYQFESLSQERRVTIQVPFALGDHQGDLTNFVVQFLAESGRFVPVTSGGRYQLDIFFLDCRDVNVGFRYDTNAEGELTNTLVPRETRSSSLVEINLWDTTSGLTVIGPARVSASVVFDHEWYSSPDAINVFSLGQVNDYSDAKDNALYPLNRELAKKIVDLVLNF